MWEEVGKRVRFIRKEHLKMSVEIFAEKLGTTRSVINNIEFTRLANPEQKMYLYKLICVEFGINEQWLLNGKGEMLLEPKKIKNTYMGKPITETEKQLICAYFNIDIETRKKLIYPLMRNLLKDYVDTDR